MLPPFSNDHLPCYSMLLKIIITLDIPTTLPLKNF